MDDFTKTAGQALASLPSDKCVIAPGLCGTGTLACAKVSFWRKHAPAGVPVPNKRSQPRFDVPRHVRRSG